MKIIIIVSIFISLLQADACQDLYEKTKLEYKKVDALSKNSIASKKAYEIINEYLSLGSETIAACANVDGTYGFRITRELDAQMKRVSLIRDDFKVLTFNELKQEAARQAKEEAKCVNVYNNTYIRGRRNDGATILPIGN